MRYLFLLLFVFSASAQTTLRPCIDFRADILQQKLNKTKDTLILSSNYIIETVTVINEKYRIYNRIDSEKAKISLAGLPSGNNKVMVILNRKIITLNIIKQ